MSRNSKITSVDTNDFSLSQKEIESIQAGIQDIKNGDYVVINNPDELDRFLEELNTEANND